MEFFPQEIVTLSSQKYGFGNRDPKKPIPIQDPGVKMAQDPGSGTQHLTSKTCSKVTGIQDPELFGANPSLVLHIRK